MNTKNNSRLAMTAVMTALAVVILLLTVSPMATVGLAALAAVCGIPVVVEWDRKAGLIHFAAVAVLALLIVPTVEGKGMYLAFFGWYTVYKAFIENKKLPFLAEWAAKIGAFLVAVTAYGAVWVWLLHMPIPAGFALWMLPVIALALCAVSMVWPSIQELIV